jgi:Leucine-rich repeat (LRR) protein
MTGSANPPQDHHQTPYQVALERIEEAKRTNATHLNLGLQSLEVLPPEVGELTELQFLILEINQLRHLPSEICNLSNLNRTYAVGRRTRVGFAR